MTGGFLKGALTGTIVAGLVAGTASVLSDPPRRSAPEIATVGLAPGSGFDPRHEESAATLPDAERRPEPGDPPRVAEPAPGDAAPSTGAAPAPAAATRPDIDGAEAFGRSPVPQGTSGVRAGPGDSPVASDPPSPIPEAAEADPPVPSAALPAERVAPPAPAAERRAKPPMALVLMEVAGSTVRFETLESFPYPLTIALDPRRRGAAQAAARYREAGFETVLIVDLPDGGAPADMQTALQSRLDRVPGAVAVLEGGADGVPVAGAAAVLAQGGQGLVTLAPPPETARRALALAGVPVIVLHRDLDGQGQAADAIEEALEQAAATADPQRGVIVLGRMRADTLRALSRWSGQGGARQVTLAPVSAVLDAQPAVPTP